MLKQHRWRIEIKESVRPTEATARQHHSPKIHSPVTVVTAFKTIITTMLKSVSAKLTRMKLVFVRRWRNFLTETQIKEFPTIVAKMMKVNTTIWATILIVPLVESSDSPSAIALRCADKSSGKVNSPINRTFVSWLNGAWIKANAMIVASCYWMF